MVAIRWLQLLWVIALLSGCDRFYGPVIRNGYSQNIEIVVSYDDGTKREASWPPCRTSYLGQERKTIKGIFVVVNGEISHEFTEAEIRDFVERGHKESGYAAWVIDSSGVHLSTEKNCPNNP